MKCLFVIAAIADKVTVVIAVMDVTDERLSGN